MSSETRGDRVKALANMIDRCGSSAAADLAQALSICGTIEGFPSILRGGRKKVSFYIDTNAAVGRSPEDAAIEEELTRARLERRRGRGARRGAGADLEADAVRFGLRTRVGSKMRGREKSSPQRNTPPRSGQRAQRKNGEVDGVSGNDNGSDSASSAHSALNSGSAGSANAPTQVGSVVNSSSEEAA